MAFADISTKAKTRLSVFMAVEVYDTDADASETLYLSDGAWGATTAVDGTKRQWRGRLRSWTVHKRDQVVGAAGWNHPTFQVEIMVHDSDDWLFAYLTDNWLWEGRPATVYLVDMDQADGAGAMVQIIGTVDRGPEDLSLNSSFTLLVQGNHHKVRLLNSRLDAPTKLRTGFVQPAQMSANDVVLTCGGITADATVVKLSGGFSAAHSGYRVGRMITFGSGVGAEAVRIGVVNGQNLSNLTRGYAGTSAVAHGASQSAICYKVGPNSRLAPSGTAQSVLPYPFGEQASHRGPVFECRALAYAGALNDWTAGTIEAWFCTGKVTGGGTAWKLTGGEIVTDAAPLVYNDLDSPLNSPVHPHVTPNWTVAGSYLGHWDKTDFEDDVFTPDSDRMWIRHSGVRDGGGNVLDTPDGIFEYLLCNSNWSFGWTLSDVVYTGRIDGGNDNGDWADEYSATDTWWGEVQGEVPRYGDKDPPLLMPVLQELADLHNADVFVRAGKLYPKRRTAGSRSADVTITADDLYGGVLPRRSIDPHNLYANELRCGMKVPVWSQPVTSPESLDPAEVPYTIRLEDNEQIGIRGDRIVGQVDRTWWWLRPSTTWRQGSDADDGTAHLGFWRAAHQVMAYQRSQRQIWMEVELPARFAWLEQGMLIDYDISPYTTVVGQIRDVKISRNLEATGGIKVTVRSWHVDFDE